MSWNVAERNSLATAGVFYVRRLRYLCFRYLERTVL
jgi:hypothetical protein